VATPHKPLYRLLLLSWLFRAAIIAEYFGMGHAAFHVLLYF
jgi:hypothetical protein